MIKLIKWYQKILKKLFIYILPLIYIFNIAAQAFDCGKAGGTEAFANTQAVSQGPNSTYFDPTVLLEYKMCGLWICGCHRKEFKVIGECDMVGGMRFCGRFVPANEYGNNSNHVRACVFVDSLDGADTDFDVMPHNQGPENHVVVSNAGCVDRPPAPFPPPFCSTLNPTIMDATIEKVCGEGEKATFTKRCVSTRKEFNSIDSNFNRFEKSLVRVGYKNFVPKCRSGSNNSSCVQICNVPADINEINEKYQSILPLCEESDCSSATNTCIIYKGTKVSTKDKLRIVYDVLNAQNKVVSTEPVNWFSTDSGTDNSRLSIHGVNDSDFYDLEYDFANFNYDTSQSTIQTFFGSSKDIFQPILSNKRYYSGTFEPYVESNNLGQICVKQTVGANSKNVGCAERPRMPKPVVAQCGGEKACYCPDGSDCGNCTTIQDRCNSDSESPKIIIGFGYPLKEALIELNNRVYTNVILYGANFSALATDENYNFPNFNQPNLVGKYDHTGKYLNGVEYTDGKYIRGATQICATGYDTKEVILTKLLKYTNFSEGSNLLSDRIYPNPPNYSYTIEAKKCDRAIPSACPNNSRCCNSCNSWAWGNNLDSDGKCLPGHIDLALLSEPVKICKNSDGTYRNLPSCPVGEKCCNSCNSWVSGNNLDSNGKCLPGYIDVAKILTSPYNNYDQNSIPAVCHDSQGNQRVFKCPSGVSCCNSCTGTPSCKQNPTYTDVAKLINYDNETLRSKNPLELNLCVSVPEGRCPAITNSTPSSVEDGFANWEEEKAGNEQIGECIDGYVGAYTDSKGVDYGPPKRTCNPGNNKWNSVVINPCTPTAEMK